MFYLLVRIEELVFVEGIKGGGWSFNFFNLFDKDIDPEGKKFDRTSRLHCESESFKEISQNNLKHSQHF